MYDNISTVDLSVEFIICFFPLADEIDLLNVSFDGKSAPDRVSARAGVNELERISPLRR